MKSGGGNLYWVPRYLLINLVNVSIYMFLYYTLKHVQIPKFFNTKKYILFALSLLLSTIIAYSFWRLMGLWWIDELRQINRGKGFVSLVDYITQSVQFYSPAMLLLVWESQEERKKEQERIRVLEKEKMSTELKFLKAQLNPHFLFNTLNNLYSYVVNNSPKAPDMILRLSAILDYVLYESQKKRVPLSKEIETIENFIGLEKIRYGDRLSVDFKTNGDLQIPISPLVLLSIVENAFKHGASGDIDSPKIKIQIMEDQGSVVCNVWNSKSKYNGELNDAYKSGIGLSNIKRQLNLIYPKQFDLQIDDMQNEFNISLHLTPGS